MALLLTALASSCGSRRSVTTPEPGVVPDSVATLADADEAFDYATAAYANWQHLKVPFSARVNGVGMTLSGNAFFERNHEIYLSAKFLGLEVAVASITPDSVTLLDKYHRIYVSEPTSLLTDIFPLTVGNLQDLLLGHCFIPGDEAANGGPKMRRKMEFYLANGGWMAAPSKLKGRLADVACQFLFNDDHCLASFDAEVDSHHLTAYYGEPAMTPDELLGDFASTVTVAVPATKTTYGGELKWNWRKAQASEAPAMRIPADCRRVELAELLKQLKAL